MHCVAKSIRWLRKNTIWPISLRVCNLSCRTVNISNTFVWLDCDGLGVQTGGVQAQSLYRSGRCAKEFEFPEKPIGTLPCCLRDCAGRFGGNADWIATSTAAISTSGRSISNPAINHHFEHHLHHRYAAIPGTWETPAPGHSSPLLILTMWLRLTVTHTPSNISRCHKETWWPWWRTMSPIWQSCSYNFKRKMLCCGYYPHYVHSLCRRVQLEKASLVEEKQIVLCDLKNAISIQDVFRLNTLTLCVGPWQVAFEAQNTSRWDNSTQFLSTRFYHFVILINFICFLRFDRFHTSTWISTRHSKDKTFPSTVSKR